MSADNPLNQLTIPTPCPASWDRMKGDDRERLCETCGKHVYNIAAMTSAEAVGLIRDRRGELCGRLFRRPDGTIVTADCPVTGRWQFSLRGIMSLIAWLAAAFGLAKMMADAPVVVTAGRMAIPRATPGGTACPTDNAEAVEETADEDEPVGEETEG
jgi:hypothetical protein